MSGNGHLQANIFYQNLKETMNEAENISPIRGGQNHFKRAKIELRNQSSFDLLTTFPKRKMQALNQVFFLENQSIESAWILSFR
jgi:hypothetical protein